MQEADVYSLGVVLWEIWSGNEPWEGLHGQELYCTIVKEKRTLPLSLEHSGIAQLLRLMFNKPDHRPNIKQVANYFKSLHNFM